MASASCCYTMGVGVEQRLLDRVIARRTSVISDHVRAAGSVYSVPVLGLEKADKTNRASFTCNAKAFCTCECGMT